MDSTDPRTRGRWRPLPTRALTGILPWILPWILGASALPACAVPCLDDGLGQKFCPELSDGSGTSDAISTSDTNTETTGGASGSGDGEGCALLDVILIPQTPTIMLLVDQSGSMGQDFGGDTRWNVISDVLLDPNNGIVPQFESSIRFGLTLYSGQGADPQGPCPNLIEVDPALDNFAAIDATMGPATPLQNTPTGESLDAVWQKLAALDPPGIEYIVLATDGLPDTCAQPEPSEGQPEAVAAAEAAHAAGIDTYIISVGDDVGASHLQDMANAGQGVMPGDPDAEFYLALDEAALVAAFEQIIAGVRSCQLDLMTPLTPEDAASCSVEVNGVVVGLDDPDGWQLNGSTEVELLGAACDTLQSGASSVQMECACELG